MYRVRGKRGKVSFQYPLNYFELILPFFCSGSIFIGLAMFLVIYARWRNRLYLSLIFLSAMAFVFVASGMFTGVIGGVMHQAVLSRQFHRTEQIAAALFLFGLPYLLTHLLVLNDTFRKINLGLSIAGLSLAGVIIIAAFAFPDLYISMAVGQDNGVYESAFGRGKAGPLYVVRDLMLMVSILYAFIIIAVDIIWHRRLKALGIILVGIAVAIFTAVDDTLFVYGLGHIGLMPHLDYSRFTMGVTAFILLTMASILQQFASQARDVARAYEALNKSEEKFLEIATNISEVFWMVDVRSRKALYVNSVYERIWARPHEPLYSSIDPWINSIHPDDRRFVTEEVVTNTPLTKKELEYRIVRPDGSIRWIRDRISPVRDTNGAVYRIARISEDITEAKLANENLTYLAYHDVLTGLFNRKSFYLRLEDIIIQARRNRGDRVKAVLVFDLDHFKDINDLFGHTAADAVLIQVSQRVKRCIRESDVLFRIGGDEFAVLLNNLGTETDTAIVAQKIIDTLTKPFSISGNTIYTGASVGIVLYPRDGADAEALVANVEAALFEAKREKGSYAFFTPEMQAKAMGKITVMEELRHAIERNELELYYQPQVDEHSRVVGAEALIRWKHPQWGFVPPIKFIPIAEETGLIVPIGRWVLNAACAGLARWAQAGVSGIPVSVNLSVRQFRDRALAVAIDEALAASAVVPSMLHLEITESTLAENVEETIVKLKELNGRGLEFSIDDFGTGYSSLSYLKRFPIKALKIDKSFVDGIPENRENTALVKAIISMAQEFGLSVVAEGVELEEQAAFLRSIRCSIIQGYVYSPPIPENEFIAFAKAHH